MARSTCEYGVRHLTCSRAWRLAGAILISATVLLATACTSDSPFEGAGEACWPLPYFTVLPVAPEHIDAATVVGGLGAPGHTLPTAHAGFYLTEEGVPVYSPGDIYITRVGWTTYLESPNRQGKTDYQVYFSPCREVEGWFGHLTTLTPEIPLPTSRARCSRYSTPYETIERCDADLRGVMLEAGAPLGTAGMSKELGLMGLDFGLMDFRTTNFYAAPHRHPQPTFHSVCPYDYFDHANREILLSAIRDMARPHEVPMGEPRCGTMEVDIVGTAQGVWVLEGAKPEPGHETEYITLANYPYRPQEKLALSLGPAELGAMVGVVPRETRGRVNRAFDQVTPDGLIYCYSEGGGSANSWLLSLESPTALRLEKVAAGGGDPCAEDPSSWAFGPAAMRFVR